MTIFVIKEIGNTDIFLHYLETTTGAVTQFDWVVQTFNFDLDTSNVYFLWIHEGFPAEQGLADPNSITSHYVNFTLSAETVATTSTSTTSSTVMPTSSTVSTTSSISTTAIQIPAATSTQVASSQAGAALSTGAQAGIGMGSALVGLAAIIGCGIFIWKSKKKGAHKLEAQQTTMNTGGDSHIPEEKAFAQADSYRPKEQPDEGYTMDPAELGSYSPDREPLELQGDFPSHRY